MPDPNFPDGNPYGSCMHPFTTLTRGFRFQLHGRTTDRGACLASAAGGVTLALALLPTPASAHVKWFAPYDVTQAPAQVDGVLTPHFLVVFAGFALMMFAGFLLDRLIASRRQGTAVRIAREATEEGLLRAGIGAFFMALFATGGVILTPELRTDADWPAWLQLGIAVSLMSARTCVLGGFGILVLYADGIANYGFFHLSDYPMFLGLAAYLGLTSSRSDRLRALRMPALYVAICLGLMWGAVEKWAYPQWTFPLLATHPYLTLGVASQDYMIIAGFIEFALAFYIMTGLALVRLAIAALLSIFMAAILDFGKVDAIGHLPIMVPMLAMFLHGPTGLHRWFHDASNSLVAEARKSTTAFATCLCFFFAVYYGLQYQEYGHATHHAAFAALAQPH